MSSTPEWQEVEMMIAVKAYPNLTEGGEEASCSAGITADGKWLRLFPIYYTTLPNDKKYKKYDIVRMKIRKSARDPRPESMEVDNDSITIIRSVGPEKNWRERRRWMNKAIDESMCEIARQQRLTGKSMGAFRPASVVDVELHERKLAAREIQLKLLDPEWRPMPEVPYSFRLHYYCSDTGCKGHTQTIVDWEGSQLFWRLKRQGLSVSEIHEKMREIILGRIFSPKNDTVVFCGNIMKFPRSFIIGGFFYPRTDPQKSLFDW